MEELCYDGDGSAGAPWWGTVVRGAGCLLTGCGALALGIYWVGFPNAPFGLLLFNLLLGVLLVASQWRAEERPHRALLVLTVVGCALLGPVGLALLGGAGYGIGRGVRRLYRAFAED